MTTLQSRNPTVTSSSWYGRQLARGLQTARGKPRGTVSCQWGYRHGDLRRERLYEVLLTIRNFARLAEAPANTDIRLANKQEIDVACAGYYDPALTQPYILVCEEAIFRAPPDRQIDVAIALALHETMHLRFSHSFYLRMRANDYKQELKPLENLLEDWRIEELLAHHYSGYASYLDVAREVLIVDQSLRAAIAAWDQLPDLDRTLVIITTYLRAPMLLEQNPLLKTWRNLLGRTIFADLCTHLGDVPESGEQVARIAHWLWSTYFEDYCTRALDLMFDDASACNEDSIARLAAQGEADREEQRFRERAANQETEQAPSRPRFSLASLAQNQHLDQTVRQGSRTETIEAVKKMDRAAQRSAELHSSTNLRRRGDASRPQLLPSQFINDWDHAAQPPVKAPSTPAGERIYRHELAAVRSQVARLRSAFPPPLQRRARKGGFTSGSIDPRRLYRAPFTDTLFQRRPHLPNHLRKHLLVMLLDASGSMSHGGRGLATLRCAVMVNEAFAAHGSIEAHFYSHTTAGSRLLLHYYGAAGKLAAGPLGTYQATDRNFDHLAIWSTVQHQDQHPTSPLSKTLIVLSDGLPCSLDGSTGEAGVALTRGVVQEVRKRGWRVLAVGIGDSFCDSIYDARFARHIPAAGKLPGEMASLLGRFLRPYLTGD